MEKRNEKELLKKNSGKMKCKIVSSIEKVLPSIEPGEMKEGLTALKGETVSFQIAYLWEGKNKLLGELTEPSIFFSMTESSKELFSAKSIRAREVMLVPCSYPNHMETDEDYLVTSPGLYPDLLRDIDKKGFSVVSGQWRSIWVDFEIPSNVAAGAYDIRFIMQDNKIMKSDETFLEEVEIHLDVIDEKLPELEIPHTEWFHCDCLSDYYHVPVFSEEHWKIMEAFIKTAVKRKCNMLYTPVFTPPLDTMVGGERPTVQLVDVYMTDQEPFAESRYSFGFEKFERWISMGERCGIKYYEISHLFTQWGAKAAPKIMALVNGQEKKIFGWKTEAGQKEYRNFLQQFLAAFDKELHALNIQDRVYFHVSDEPTKEQQDSYKAAKELIAEQLKDYHIVDAISNYDFYENKLIREPICASDQIKDFLKEGKRPEKLWVYYCTVQNLNVSNRFIAMPGSRTRIIGDMIYRQKVDGFLHWGFNFYNSQYSLYSVNPYQITDADGAFPSGDPFLVYPGHNGEPEESIRMMLMDEAFADYCALKLLEKLTDLETVLSCFEEEIFGMLTFDSYPKQHEYVTRVRSNVNKKIQEAIQHKEEKRKKS